MTQQLQKGKKRMEEVLRMEWCRMALSASGWSVALLIVQDVDVNDGAR